MVKYNLQIEFSRPVNKNLLSILIPVRKDVEGLVKTLNSIKEQTLNNKDFEVLVGNDGEDMQVKEICRQFNLVCVDVKLGNGSYFVRNRLLEQSSGELISFIDAGVVIGKNYLQNGIDSLNKYDYLGGPIEIIATKNQRNEMLFTFQKVATFSVDEYMSNLHFSPTANLFVKRKVIEIIGGFDERLYSSGDYEFGDRVFKSNLFLQYFDDRLVVYHEPRSYASLIKKQKRLAWGFIKLSSLYPNRFQKLNSNFIVGILKAFFPPVRLFKRKLWLDLPLREKVGVFIIAYYFGFIGNMFKVCFSLFKLHDGSLEN